MAGEISRRDFLTGSAVAVGAFGLGEQPARAFNNAGLRIRKSALELPPGDSSLQAYASAVEELHKLPANDSRNWRRLAEVHADHCVHQKPDFLHWHRHYVNYFEQICGEVLGDRSFALPYWDWSYDTGKLPDPFFLLDALRVEHWKDAGSYVSPSWGEVDTLPVRALKQGQGVQNVDRFGSFFKRDRIDQLLSLSEYSTFVRDLEGGPHNAGHLVVGAMQHGKDGHMFSGLSPLDPIFWLHHANVDRLWAQWQIAGNKTPELDASYQSVFTDPKGREIAQVSAASAVDFGKLGYTYELFGPDGERTVLEEVAADSRAERENAKLRQAKPVGSAVGLDKVVPFVVASISIQTKTLSQELLEETPIFNAVLPPLSDLRRKAFDREAFGGFGKVVKAPRQVLLRLNDVHGEFDEAPIVGVFLNHPKLTGATRFAGDHFAGAFALFGPSHAEHGASSQFIVNLTSVLRGTADLRGIDRIEVQLVTVPASGSDSIQGSFSIGSAEVLSL